MIGFNVLRITLSLALTSLLFASEMIFAEELLVTPEIQSIEQEAEGSERGIKKKRDELTTQPVEITPELVIENDADAVVLPKVLPVQKTDGQLSVIQKIDVKKIEFDGLTVFTRDQLASLLEPVEGKTVTFETLNSLRHKLSELYLNKGYINSGVTIPDQKVKNGIIVLKVIEGDLTNIEIEGLERLDKSYVENTIFNIVGKPLNVLELSEALKLLEQDRLIQQVNARLLPGKNLGESTLRVTVKEDSAFYYALGVDNYLSPSVGAERVTINVGHANVFGLADQFDANIDIAEGLSGVNFYYDVPFTKSGTSFGIYGDIRDYITVERPFDEIDIESEYYQYGLRISQPFIKRLDEELNASFGFEVKHSESTLLEQPFSFSLGAVDGVSDISVLDMSLNWVNRSPGSVFSFDGALRFGLLALDATDNEGDIPDSEFTVLKGQLQYAHLLKFAKSQLLFRSGFQLSADPLLAIEKYAVGGRYSVRGYRENQFVRDNGVTATFEWRIPLMLAKDNRYKLQMVPFLDAGSSWDQDENLSKTTKESISSIGLGLLWDPTTQWHLELFYAHGFKDLPEVYDSDLQDNGIHFQFTYQSGR